MSLDAYLTAAVGSIGVFSGGDSPCPLSHLIRQCPRVLRLALVHCIRIRDPFLSTTGHTADVDASSIIKLSLFFSQTTVQQFFSTQIFALYLDK